jgi:hypothetical protein
MPINTQKSFSAENLKDTKINDFQTEDLRKREINTADLREKIIIIGFSTQDTSDYMIEWQTEVGYETGITLDGYDEISIISVADVSSFSRFMKPFVRRVLRDTYKKANEKLLERFVEHKTEPPDDIGDRIYFVPDWSGDIVKGLGIENQMVKPHMFIIDTKGNIAGHFSENTKENKDKTYSIVKNLLNEIKAQEG